MSAYTLTIFCGVAGALALAAGAGLLIVPGRTLRERTWLRRWLLENDLIALLDRRQSIERPLYRHHRGFGTAVMAGAIASFVALWALPGQPLVTGVLTGALGAWGAEAVIVTSWALALFALVIGVFLLIRPSALKGIETTANRWIEPFSSPRRAAVPLDTGINRLIMCAPRFTGLLFLVAGLGCLLAFAR